MPYPDSLLRMVNRQFHHSARTHVAGRLPSIRPDCKCRGAAESSFGQAATGCQLWIYALAGKVKPNSRLNGRAPDHDSYWAFRRDQLLQLLLLPLQQTVDIGCGEGRLTRHLKAIGHHVIGIDASPSRRLLFSLEKAGLLVKALREPSLPDHAIVSDASRCWQRIPLYLHLRACRP
jgi:Methyltransferase domain